MADISPKSNPPKSDPPKSDKDKSNKDKSAPLKSDPLKSNPLKSNQSGSIPTNAESKRAHSKTAPGKKDAAGKNDNGGKKDDGGKKDNGGKKDDDGGDGGGGLVGMAILAFLAWFIFGDDNRSIDFGDDILRVADLAAKDGPKRWSDAHRLAFEVSGDDPKTFYCRCPYRGKKPDLEACGYHIRKNEKRANRVELEHVVPVSKLAEDMDCWQDAGAKNVRNKRSYCRRHSEKFRVRESNLINLVPAIGEVNGDRSNYDFGEIKGNISPQYGACDIAIDFKKRVAEPHNAIKGDIARIYFLMDSTYDIDLTSDQKDMFEQWHEDDPVDGRELRRYVRIASVIKRQSMGRGKGDGGGFGNVTHHIKELVLQNRPASRRINATSGD